MFGTDSCLQLSVQPLSCGFSSHCASMTPTNASSCKQVAGCDPSSLGAVVNQHLRHPQQQQQQQQKQPQHGGQATQQETFEFDDTFDEDVDDDFTEEEYQEMRLERPCSNTPDVSDITHQLLQFADLVNTDIQKFFGRKKAGDKENIDIYEDRWKSSGKSGRELYYADLLRMAKGGDDWDDAKTRSGSPVEQQPSNQTGSRNYDYSGKMDKKAGLGPLMELFHHGLKKYLDDKKLHKFNKKIKRLQNDGVGKKTEHDVPMHQRQFPESFWKEPSTKESSNSSNTQMPRRDECLQSSCSSAVTKHKVNGLLNLSNQLDFSDLLESWDVGDTDELSTSPESNQD